MRIGVWGRNLQRAVGKYLYKYRWAQVDILGKIYLIIFTAEKDIDSWQWEFSYN